jgi:hypothetical protein
MSKRLTLNIGVRWDVTLWPINGSQGKPSSYIGDVDLSNGSYILSALPPPCSATVGVRCIPGGTLPQHVVVTGQSNGAILHNSYNNWRSRSPCSTQSRSELIGCSGISSRCESRWKRGVAPS